ncbi:hypothetical protein H257_13034 [Aphanomyces astaci]|uniref:Uncharacterized protein n=1 Tax=Aphanomyces astaci TaxID=112090 RepID=W4FYL8_APHAT|nr:hypothetical protein H257_13034 [Aphanomyces astaci]ETV71904.1 hypothetical protein H257_13034 [Aphanomyces astaci]|eukprot:XP_009838753.1 hypothetical protein H257_13034 [Aphanomyces astaci]
MKTAGLLSILAVAAANQHKISPSVFELLQQSSTVTVFVAIERAFDLHKRSSLHDNTKCSSAIGTIFLCKELTEDDIFTAAALPEVEEIFPVPDSSAPDPPNISPKPTTTPKPAVTTPKPVVSDDVAAADRDKIVASSVLESLQQSSTVNVLVEHDYLGTLEMPESSSLFTHPKCKGGLLSGQVDCKDLTKEEIYSIAALPEVYHILPARDNSVSDTPNITPKPTTTPKPAVTTPKPVVSDDVAAADRDKIVASSVLESLQQSSTVNVLVEHDYLGTLEMPESSSLFTHPKCKGGLLSGQVDCKDLTKEEIYSIAALPEVYHILPARDNSVSDTPNITPKPTTTPKPAVTTPKPVVSDDDAVDYQHKIGPGVLQSLQQSTTVTVSVAVHDNSPDSVVYTFHKCLKHPPLPGLLLCNDLTLDEVNRFAALPEVKEILATRDNSVSDIPNITPKPTTTAATPTHSEQRDSSDDRD